MKKQELIQQILILDNVGETDHLDLKKMKKNELEILHYSILNFAHSRQNNWIKAFSERPSKEIS